LASTVLLAINLTQLLILHIVLLLYLQQAESLLHEVVDEKFYCALPEITVYLKESIGNQTRIDYGTGSVISVRYLSVENIIGLVLHYIKQYRVDCVIEYLCTVFFLSFLFFVILLGCTSVRFLC